MLASTVKQELQSDLWLNLQSLTRKVCSEAQKYALASESIKKLFSYGIRLVQRSS